jgi:hypothetical protein
MSNINYDINYGAIPPGCISGGYGSDTITLDYTSQPSVVLNSTMSSGNGTIPYTFTTTGTGGTSTYNPFYGATTTNAVWTNSGDAKVHINGDGLVMQEGADIVVGGKSLTKAIEQIEERLCILHPNPALEDRWNQLKELREQYIEMERDLLEKEKLMKILKEA